MQTLEQLLENYGEHITVKQLETIKANIERFKGIRSIWYDSINDCVMVCWENTGFICGIERDGYMHS